MYHCRSIYEGYTNKTNEISVKCEYGIAHTGIYTQTQILTHKCNKTLNTQWDN